MTWRASIGVTLFPSESTGGDGVFEYKLEGVLPALDHVDVIVDDDIDVEGDFTVTRDAVRDFFGKADVETRLSHSEDY